MKNVKKTFSATALLAAFLLLFSCNPVEDDSRSASQLIVQNILGNDSQGGSANFLQSDVVLSNGSVRADSVTATLRADTVDTDPLMGTSQYNDIIITRYLVSFSRTDGKNVPGQDVPYPFEGSMSALISAGSSISLSLVLVREVAKLEPPLIELVDLGAEVVLTCVAKIEFYGHDLANREVKATGYLTVYFANYADSAS